MTTSLKSIYVCLFYRPPNILTNPITNLRASLSRSAIHNPDMYHCSWLQLPCYGNISPTVASFIICLLWLWTWTTCHQSSEKQSCIRFLSTHYNHYTHPDLISNINVMLGISDYETVTFKIKFTSNIPPCSKTAEESLSLPKGWLIGVNEMLHK